jgi:hypothetical protein
MKRLWVILASSFFLISAVNMASAESWVFKNPSAYYTDSQLVSEGKSVNLIKFTTSEDTIKKDSTPNEVSRPNIYLKLQWDKEKPITYMQLGKHYEEKEDWQMLQFFLLLHVVIP